MSCLQGDLQLADKAGNLSQLGKGGPGEAALLRHTRLLLIRGPVEESCIIHDFVCKVVLCRWHDIPCMGHPRLTDD